jgi:hypothetical protein
LPASTLARLRLDRSALFGLLYRHHRHHHRLARMRWVNFNISCPFADHLFGTLEDEQAWGWERRRRDRARSRATSIVPANTNAHDDPLPDASSQEQPPATGPSPAAAPVVGLPPVPPVPEAAPEAPPPDAGAPWYSKAPRS